MQGLALFWRYRCHDGRLDFSSSIITLFDPSISQSLEAVLHEAFPPLKG